MITRKTNNWDGAQLDIIKATKWVCHVEEKKRESYTVRDCLLSHLGKTWQAIAACPPATEEKLTTHSQGKIDIRVFSERGLRIWNRKLLGNTPFSTHIYIST